MLLAIESWQRLNRCFDRFGRDFSRNRSGFSDRLGRCNNRFCDNRLGCNGDRLGDNRRGFDGAGRVLKRRINVGNGNIAFFHEFALRVENSFLAQK